MKRILALVLVFSAAAGLRADLFFGPTAPANRFIVPAGQAALISGIHPQYAYSETGERLDGTFFGGARILVGATAKDVYLSECTNGLTALAGPLELVLTNVVAVNYRLVKTTALFSPTISFGETTTIEIPAGKSIRFLSFSLDGYRPLIANATLIKNGVERSGFDLPGDSQFDGSLGIRIYYPPAAGPTLSWILPYYITDQATVLPEQLAVQAPTGAFQIQLEKSSDLNAWSPSVTLPVQSDTKSFYRLQIQK
jgi:hypothetical protein